MYCFIAPVTEQKTTDTYTSEFFRSSNNKNAKDMENLKYYSMIPNDKPEWLLRLQMDISQYYSIDDSDDEREYWRGLKDYVDAKIWEMYNRRDVKLRSDVASVLVTDEGKTVLHIKRNGKIVQIYYLKDK